MSESIGVRLRQARELRRLTIAQVAETTKLRSHYLQALENDDYSAIPSGAQARGFLRLYAEFLQLDLEELLRVATPAAAEPGGTAEPEPAARPGLWASLRERLGRRPAKQQTAPDTGASELPPALEPQPAAAKPAVDAALPAAVADIQTTQRARPASPEVKKNAVK